jgi:hypothetical protein
MLIKSRESLSRPKDEREKKGVRTDEKGTWNKYWYNF